MAAATLACAVALFASSLAAPTTSPQLPLAQLAASDSATDLTLDVESLPAGNHNSSQDQPAADCSVAGAQYAHGQQVARLDPCELCLCLDGDLFCWWQDCPSASIACRESPAFAAACSGVSENGTTTQAVSIYAGSEPVTPGTLAPEAAAATGAESNSTSSTPASGTAEVSDTAAPPPVTASTAPTACHVMGTEYKIGEVLPRDTGTCLECVCDSEARVTCSPKDCATHDDFHGSNNLDMFDVDTF